MDGVERSQLLRRLSTRSVKRGGPDADQIEAAEQLSHNRSSFLSLLGGEGHALHESPRRTSKLRSNQCTADDPLVRALDEAT